MGRTVKLTAGANQGQLRRVVGYEPPQPGDAGSLLLARDSLLNLFAIGGAPSIGEDLAGATSGATPGGTPGGVEVPDTAESLLDGSLGRAPQEGDAVVSDGMAAEGDSAEQPVTPDLHPDTVLAAERLVDLQRLQAEYVNYKRRVDRDRELARDAGTAAVLEGLLPVLDDIHLAREHGDLVDGPFAAIADKLLAALGRFGVTPLGAAGEGGGAGVAGAGAAGDGPVPAPVASAIARWMSARKRTQPNTAIARRTTGIDVVVTAPVGASIDCPGVWWPLGPP